MKFRKAIIEQSKEELKIYSDNMKSPAPMFNPTDGKGTNATETTISARPSNPDNEELIIQIERAVMLGNFESAYNLMQENWERLTLNDINRLTQFERYIWGDNVRNLAAKKMKPDFGRFGPRFIKSVKKKLAPR